ncbi:MAG: ATP-binding protein [Elusimicrobia bacterium]|nr:ATP-binding protein [Elusimicrobiota bacterium]
MTGEFSVVERFFKLPKQSFFLLGPRGTGKSTLVRSAIKKALWIDLLSEESFRKYSARPEFITEVVEGLPDHSTVVVDEIQRVPSILNEIHRLIEKKRGWRFILTGSSARKLKREGANLLGGRALVNALHPFMAGELGNRFSLEKALSVGMLPLIHAAPDPDKQLAAYAGVYLREEVQREGLVRNLGGFARFLEVISFSHGSLLNATRVAEDTQVKRSSIEGYLRILEDLLLSFQLSVFNKRAKRDVIAHPKFYYFDTGVFRSLRPQGPLDHVSELEGQCLEGLVAQHLRAWCAYRDQGDQLFFWRTRWGLEVDFVVYGRQGIFALEVKNADRVRSDDLKGLAAFREDYPEARVALLYRGKNRLLVKGIPCLPCENFLRNLGPLSPVLS